ncbi:MAG TPA: Si-specific NAD(P)(+) transhydrogenase [Candidatus Binataceae bacterium]|nr:Si-specific NAD(P)(+) transhydrogenase [Candidatus Binataceae bacterium]
MPEAAYELLVIGSGPAGHHAAIQAAKLRRRALLVERKSVVGGTCINVGTIPSKTMREAVIYLSGYREHSIYGQSYKVKDKITLQDLLFRVEAVVRHEIDVSRHQLMRNGIEVVNAEASFMDQHTLRLRQPDGRGESTVTADNVVIAVGTEAIPDPRIPLDGSSVMSSDDILGLQDLPRSLIVIGGGVIGCEYASMFAALDVRVTLVDMRPRLLPFVDAEIAEALTYQLRNRRVTLRLGEKVGSVEVEPNGGERQVRVILESGKQIIADKALSCMGRVGAVSKLNLAAAGIAHDPRGKIAVNHYYQTEVPHIYATGDIVGFPSLASTSKEQGRLAVCHAFGVEARYAPELFPYGIFTIPEISFVGQNEEELTDQGIPYEIGKAHYREIARGQILGDNHGMLKLIFHRETHLLLGVHIIGDGAAELVHIGQAVLAAKGQIHYFIDTVFNYPTLAECYKNAAFDGVNRLHS